MFQIAVYGKGGIGKSTITANLSASLALAGKRVLQVGCDPKHDSTNLLVHGRGQRTALDYLRHTSPADYRIEDVLETGFAGVGCVEAGGPEPGVGCAGRGIISTFELLDRFKIKEAYDIVCYDVLGDVVCGGFAVPIRREYADAVFVVTSGEFMALYAANNILRGLRNYDFGENRVAGIIYNSRNVQGEDERVERFAREVQLPIVLKVPRSDAFARAEVARRTVVELGEDAALVDAFARLARRVVEGLPLYEAHPLTDEELEAKILGTNRLVEAASDESGASGGSLEAGTAREASIHGASPQQAPFAPASAPEVEREPAPEIVSEPAPAPKSADTSAPEVEPAPAPAPATIGLSNPNRYLSKNMANREPLHGCAYNGACMMALQVRDAVVVAHAPTHCFNLTRQTATSTGRRVLYERGAVLPASLAPPFACTNMSESDMVFGGTGKLLERVGQLKQRRPRAIVVVSGCTAGIIGDDIDRAKQLSEPDLPVITIKADGNMSGDYLQGMLECYTALAHQVIDPTLPSRPRTVNIVFEKVVVKETEQNFAFVQGVLNRMGVTVNCRFLCNTTYDALEAFTTAELNLLAYRDYTGAMLEDFFKSEYGCAFFEHDFPVGVPETEEWVRALAMHFGCPEEGERILGEQRAEYDRRIAALRPVLAGKRLMVFTYNLDLDWIIEPAMDAGIEICKICVLDYSQDQGFRTKLDLDFPVEQNYDRTKREQDLERYRPDILLSNYASSLETSAAVVDTIPMCPPVGVESGISLLERWTRLIGSNLKEGWRDDERFFAKHAAR